MPNVIISHQPDTSQSTDPVVAVLGSAAGTIKARGPWGTSNAGVSVVAAITESARSLYPTGAAEIARAAEIALMQYLGIADDEMGLRAIAVWRTRSTPVTVVDALNAAAEMAASKLFGCAA